MTVASLVVACLALVVAAVAAWYSHRQTQAAEMSASEAKRSADAAAEVAQIEQERRAEELADAEKRHVVFALEYQSGYAYLLRQYGTNTAYGVHVDSANMTVQGAEYRFDQVQSGEAHRFLFARTMTSPDHIVVTWHYQPDRSDPAQSVKLHLH